MRADYTPPTENLGFGYIRYPRLLDFLPKFHKIGSRARKSGYFGGAEGAHRSKSPPETKSEGLYFSRNSERVDYIDITDCHEEASCDRCRRIGCFAEKEHHFQRNNETIFSAYGTALVESSAPDVDPKFRHATYVFLS